MNSSPSKELGSDILSVTGTRLVADEWLFVSLFSYLTVGCVGGWRVFNTNSKHSYYLRFKSYAYEDVE